jgi:capsule polysaccharide export protein KpsC/LpsZ
VNLDGLSGGTSKLPQLYHTIFRAGWECRILGKNVICITRIWWRGYAFSKDHLNL